MSSCYTAAQLEAMRKEQIRKELNEAIEKLKQEMEREHTQSVERREGSHIELSVFAEDDAQSGACDTAAVTGETLRREQTGEKTEREELDFSSLLREQVKKPSKSELELDSWIKRIDERPLLTERDAKDRTRLLAELAKIVHSADTDIEDQIRFVKMRVSAYLQGAPRQTEADREQLRSLFCEYRALCQMLGMQPVEKYPYRISKETERMRKILEKRSQDAYIMEVIEDIMEELGCHARDNAVLDHTAGQLYAVDGHPLCDVFVGSDGRGIMFEPVGETNSASLEKKRQIEHSANAICGLYDEIEQRAAERGVILTRVYAEPSQLGTMHVQSDISERTERKQQRKAGAQKKKALAAED